MKKWAFIDRSPTQNRASGGPFGSSRTSFRVLMYAACPLGRLPRFLPRLMKSEVNTAIPRFLEGSSAPGFRACNRPKRGRAIWRGSLGQRHNGSRSNLVTGANENRNRRSEVAKNEEMLTLSWTALEARSSIPHASPEECLDGTPWEAQSRNPRLRGKDLGSGCLRKDGFDARLERHRAGEGYSYGCPVF